jgi:hypothetical protein
MVVPTVSAVSHTTVAGVPTITALPDAPNAMPENPQFGVQHPTQLGRSTTSEGLITQEAASALCSLLRTCSSSHLSHSNSLNDLGIYMNDDILEDVADSGKSPHTSNAVSVPSDWNNVSPNQLIAQLKLLKGEVCEQHGLWPFYKSYSNWEKMTSDQ